MKTPMQELEEFIKVTPRLKDDSTLNTKVTELLKKEQQQIIDAHTDGQADLLNPSIREITRPNRQYIAKSYFTNKYKQ